MRRFIFFLLVVALGLYAWTRLRPWQPGDKYTIATEPKVSVKDVEVLAAMDAEYTKLVQAVVPSVVSIATARHVQVPIADPLDFFFGRRRRVAEHTENALGSGVIVSKEGHILTNHHVIENTDEIRVQLTDGRVLPAQLIGSDPAVDLAVLRVNASNLSPLPFGDSDQVRAGQMVFAIGNPFGLQETVTRGIISAKGRALRDSGVEMLQTDAAVNPGNSGGPLLNLHGEIVGINSAIYSQSGAWAGISFAIPSNVARSTLDSLLKTGRPARGSINAEFMALNTNLAQQLGAPDTRGALVTSVTPGSASEKAGLQPRDIIRAFNGQPAPNPSVLRSLISQAGLGSKAELDILRNGQAMHLSSQITDAQEEPDTQTPDRNDNVLAGITVSEIPANTRRVLPPTIQGVFISQVEADAPAAGRLVGGDIIESINNQPIHSIADFQKAVQALRPTDRAVLYIIRGRFRSFVVLAP